jgi:hypothetical protein
MRRMLSSDAGHIPPHEVEHGGADSAGGTDWPIVYRHRLPTRVWHWLNAGIILVMSGLMIFNAHPRLY